MQLHKRQGDLLFVRLYAAPMGAKPSPDGGILARGEATGHAHAIAPLELAKCDVLLDEKGQLVVLAREAVTVRHEEHAEVVLEPGTWEVRRQIEYQPEGWTHVAD